jgi:hypothetical protein
MLKQYIDKRFSFASQSNITIINDILGEYERQGYDLSLRQLYYQLVARGYIENSERSYKKIGDLVSDARLAGLINWDMIKDRGRVRITPSHWSSPAEIMEAAARSFRIDKWENQPNWVVVLVEKQALEGVLIPVCQSLDLPFMANKGYSSSSAMFELGREIHRHDFGFGQDCHVLYLGDHDPSGIDMTRDVEERLIMFAECPVTVHRLALNYDQVEELNPPPNPAKTTDSRFEAYLARYGEISWELDAIEPRALVKLVERKVAELLDIGLWNTAVERERRMRQELVRAAEDYRKEH